MEPRIEYVATDDGVSLACTRFGNGPPLIVQFSSPSLSHFEMEFAFPPAVALCEALARIATVVRDEAQRLHSIQPLKSDPPITSVSPVPSALMT